MSQYATTSRRIVPVSLDSQDGDSSSALVGTHRSTFVGPVGFSNRDRDYINLTGILISGCPHAVYLPRGELRSPVFTCSARLDPTAIQDLGLATLAARALGWTPERIQATIGPQFGHVNTPRSVAIIVEARRVAECLRRNALSMRLSGLLRLPTRSNGRLVLSTMPVTSHGPGLSGGQNPASTVSPLDGPPKTFWRFPRLPAELRAMIYQYAMVLPAVNHYRITEALLSPERPDVVLPLTKGTCHSSWREWRVIHAVCREAAAAVKALINRGGKKAYIDAGSRAPFHKEVDMVTFQPKMRELRSTRCHINVPPDYIHNLFGKGLRRVGIPYEPERHECPGGHGGALVNGLGLQGGLNGQGGGNAGGGPGGGGTEPGEDSDSENEESSEEGSTVFGSDFNFENEEGEVADWNAAGWPPRFFGLTDWKCRDLCKGSICQYVPWFRDADVIYLLANLYLHNIKEEVTREVRAENALRHVAGVFGRMRKVMDLEIWQDSAKTFIEVDYDVAASVVKESDLGAWRTARYLQRYVDTLDPARKALVNPDMKIKVLVSMYHLRWNPVNMRSVKLGR